MEGMNRQHRQRWKVGTDGKDRGMERYEQKNRQRGWEVSK
jgi:hypothetical protein